MQISTIALVFIIFVSLPVIAAITIVIIAYRRKKKEEEGNKSTEKKENKIDGRQEL
ncbi:MAG: hypothetical protein IPH42_02915 [Bacteroidetes bacterium]|jgi:heme/copper-type cytochrome/quinol oxidase subunit 2|nr:hypothetical protein [Bacteroidota bacterium]MBP8916769.1 hypothetical protein [Chitinophagales bacterium]